MKVPWLDRLPPTPRRRILWGAGLLLFYTVFGFLILPLIVRAVAVRQIARQLDREVSIAQVKINPYALSGTIRGLLIKDKDGQPFLSFDEAYGNFQLMSFLGHPWVFKEISTTKPFVRAQVNKDRSLNFSDLIEKFSRIDTNAPPPKPAKPLALRIGQVRITGASASLADLTPRTPFRRIVGPLNITLNNFHTDPENRTPYAFEGTTDAGGKFTWGGHFSLDPIRSRGEISLEGLVLSKYAPLYQDLVRFVIGDGVAGVRAEYDLAWSATNKTAIITNLAFNLRSLKVAEPAATNNLAELERLDVTGVSVDALAHRAEVASVTATGGRVWLRRNRDATINLLEAAKPSADATNVAGGVQFLLQSVTNVIAQILRTTNVWQATLHSLNAEDHSLRVEDFVNTRPVSLLLDGLTLHATNLSNLPGQKLTAVTSARWNTNGSITSSSVVTLFPLHAEVTLDIDRLNLAPVDPYLEPFADVLIHSGELNVHGRAELTRTNEALPDARFRGTVALEDFSTLDGKFGDDLLKWKSLRVSGIDAQLEPLGASVTEVALIEPRTRIIVNTNRHINLLSAARLEALNPLLQDTNAPPPEKNAKKKPAGKNTLTRLASRTTPSSNTTAAASLPRISIGTVALTNADFQFTDRSLQPFVNFAFSQLSGTIAGLSTEEVQRADIRLAGRVDNTAPVEITGRINPLSQKEATDVTISVKDIDLHPGSPYSGKFLGYRLNKGKLSLDVKYEVSEGKIKASNLIVIDQLTLGEKTGSPDATKLPVRLAIAVLKDRNGRIELDVPIAGTMDDPEFKLGRVITRTLLNIVTKIVTSPFAALGAVFGGKGEEISFQEFAAGASELQPAATEKLDTLVKGLYERPGLQLEIEGSIDPAADRAALARQKIEKDLRANKWKSLRKSEQARTAPEQIPITPEEYQDAVKELHAAAFKPEAIAARAAKTPGAATNAPVAATNLTAAVTVARSGEKGATALMSASTVATPARAKLAPQDLESQLLGTIEVTANDYTALAAARARRVKEYILQTGKVEADRLFLGEAAAQGGTTNGSRVYLHLR